MPSDIPLTNPPVTIGDAELLAETLRRGGVTGSQCRRDLEHAIAMVTCRQHAVALASAESALPRLLHALGIGPDRHIIVPALGDASCLRAARQLGAVPRFADCDPGTLVPTNQTIESIIDGETGAVLAFHGDGWGTGVPGIAAACARQEVPFIELVGNKLGSRFAASPAGAAGRAAVIDLSHRGIISGGEGAVIVTDDARLADACRSDDFMTSTEPHRTDPMSELAAVLATTQLSRLEEIVQICTALAEHYTVSLSNTRELLLPASTPEAIPSWSRYLVRLDETFSKDDRDEIVRGMQRHDIQAHAGLACLPELWSESSANNCPVASSTATRTIALPIHTGLSQRDVDLICQTLQLMVQRAVFRRS